MSLEENVLEIYDGSFFDQGKDMSCRIKTVKVLEVEPFDVTRYFYSIDYTFALLGLRWYAKSRIGRIANFMIFTINILTAIYTLVVSVNRVRLNPKNLFNYNYVAYNFMLILSLTIVSLWQKDIHLVYKEAINLCSHEAKQKIIRSGRPIGFTTITWTMIFFVVSCFSVNQQAIKSFMIGNTTELYFHEQILGHFILIYFKPFVSYQGAFASASYYIQLSQILFIVDRRYIQKIEELIRKNVTYNQIMAEKMTLDNVKRHFEATLSIFPFLWFLLLFQVCCGMIWGVRNFSQLDITKQKAIFEFCLYLLFMLIATVLLFGMDRSKSKLIEDNARLAEMLVRSN